MSDIQTIERLLDEIKQLSANQSDKTKRLIATKFHMIESVAQTMHIVYSVRK